LNRVSWSEAQAMVGREYTVVAPLLVCPDPAAVGNRARAWECKFWRRGAFRVEDATIANRRDIVLRIGGGEGAGVILYRTDFPRPYKEP
jgi:hypothetical protein